MKHLKKYNEALTREKIDLSGIDRSVTGKQTPRDLKSLLYGESYAIQPEYDLVETTQGNFDGEKGYVTYIIIIKRNSDGRFFRGFGEDWGKDEQFVEPVFEEVFPEQKTITIYK